MTPLWLVKVSLKDNMDSNRTMGVAQQLREEPKTDLDLLTQVTENLNLYYVPFILTTGLSLHIVCCVGFSKTKLCRKFFTQLFVCVSVADIGFLFTLFFMWLKDLDVDIYAAPGMCPMVIFMSHFFPFLSFWISLIGAVIIILQPFVGPVNKFARGSGRGKILVICMAVFTFTIYIYKTWTSGVFKIHGIRYCTVLQETRDAMKVLNILDVLFLLLLPFVGFIMFDVIIFARHINNILGQRGQGPIVRATKDAMRVILAHSVTFILFVGPGCLSKVYFYISGGPGNSSTHIRDLLLQNLFQHLFYTYFALSPLLHIIVSSSFRRHVRLSMTNAKQHRPTHETIEHIVLSDPTSEQTLL